MRLHRIISAALGANAYVFGTADFGVVTSRGIRYPDYLIEAAGGEDMELATERPLLLAEILSPSSLATDFGPKVTEYGSIVSLRHYLVLAQDEPRVWLWNRTEAGFTGPEIAVGMEAGVSLAAFDLKLSLADLYRGIA